MFDTMVRLLRTPSSSYVLVKEPGSVLVRTTTVYRPVAGRPVNRYQPLRSVTLVIGTSMPAPMSMLVGGYSTTRTLAMPTTFEAPSSWTPLPLLSRQM